MANTAPFTDWNGNMTDLGPLYPFVGTETAMVVILVVLWIVWHVVQIRMENRKLDAEARRLREADNLAKALQDEHTLERM
jgi:hypothetical protein